MRLARLVTSIALLLASAPAVAQRDGVLRCDEQVGRAGHRTVHIALTADLGRRRLWHLSLASLDALQFDAVDVRRTWDVRGPALTVPSGARGFWLAVMVVGFRPRFVWLPPDVRAADCWLDVALEPIASSYELDSIVWRVRGRGVVLDDDRAQLYVQMTPSDATAASIGDYLRFLPLFWREKYAAALEAQWPRGANAWAKQRFAWVDADANWAGVALCIESPLCPESRPRSPSFGLSRLDLLRFAPRVVSSDTLWRVSLARGDARFYVVERATNEALSERDARRLTRMR